ncbi:hypothetical protein M8998_14895 [Sphingobacterium sp. lm-10]|uniref:hypothetical protein n=1 Tax=Sphingobacterium sp. lm-10 TaxID=2944904 RepID=UPI00202086E0|nr:hypothetical protein [Sphingobacterium sp. lm-10]MCL7989235.1 hypothetical protein [Sphingobacterium sp. lm-10]
MSEPFSFTLSLIVLIFLLVLCFNVITIKKEMVKQNNLQSAILRRLELWNGSGAVDSAAKDFPFYFFLYDSKNRKFLFRNINTNGYETLPGASQYAMSMTAKKSEIELEIIKQNGITNALENIKITLKPVEDNYIDIADYVA